MRGSGHPTGYRDQRSPRAHRYSRRSHLAFALLLFACSEATPEPPPSLISGEHTLSLLGDHSALVLRRGDEQLITIPADTMQLGVVDTLDDELSYDPYWLEVSDHVLAQEPPADLRWRSVDRFEIVSATDAALTLKLPIGSSLHAELTIERTDSNRFTATLSPTSAGPVVALLRFAMITGESEHFYGLGGWPDSPEHRGKLRPMQIELEPAIESGNNEIHAPIPLLIGTSGWGVFVESRQLGLFDVAKSSADRVITTWADTLQEGLRFHILGADHPLDVTKRYYEITGDPRVPPAWTFGPLIWRDENLDQAEVEADIRTIRDMGLATSGIWIDRPYATAVNTFDFDSTAYPDPERMIRMANDAGLRVAVWHTPYLSEEATALRAEATDKRYFPPETGLLLNRGSEPIDFTNPEAFAWWQGLIQRYRAMGIEGFKLDYGEDIAPGVGGARSKWRFADGSDERTGHYEYTKLYHRAYAETLPEEGGFLLCRAARWGEQTTGMIIWPGDLDATLTAHGERFVTRSGESVLGVGGLAAAVSMGLSLGPSGLPFYGSDTGGYRQSPPNEETFVRWFQQTTFSTVMQVGDSSSQPPWVFTPENGRSIGTLHLYAESARYHMRLFPYVWSYAHKLDDDGRAIQRPLGLAHPELGVHPADIYLLGDHLLVAPVVTAGTTERSVPLPAGQWLDLDTGEVYEGPGTVTIAAPLERIPALIARGGIIPMLRPTIETLATTTDPGIDSFAVEPNPLYVTVFISSSPSRFELYDGTIIEQSSVGKELTLSISRGSVFDGAMVYELLGLVNEPTAVTIDGAAASATWSAEDGGVATVSVPATASSVTLTRR